LTHVTDLIFIATLPFASLVLISNLPLIKLADEVYEMVKKKKKDKKKRKKKNN